MKNRDIHKILHIQFVGPYDEYATYQDNLLPAEQVRHGYDVSYWTDCYAYVNGKTEMVPVVEKTLESGVHIKRFNYDRIINRYITAKVRFVFGFVKELEQFDPDMIMLHGAQTYIVLPICKYLKKHPDVRFVADNHADVLNSATSWWSKFLLHRIIYKPMVRKVYKKVEEYFCISPEARDFLIREYNVPTDKLVLLPLGGVFPSEEEYNKKRSMIRKQLSFSDDDILIVHSGKLAPEKRTIPLLKACDKLKDTSNKFKLIIIGKAENEVLKAINDICDTNSNIEYLGWKKGEELMDWLCAADVYVLAGDQSATVQNAACRRCALIVYPYDNYRFLFENEGNTLFVKDQEELDNAVSAVVNNPILCHEMMEKSLAVSYQKLDYSKQALRVIGN